MSSKQTIIQDLINLYESQKLQIQNEIRQYPPPIPACDAQFNYLLEKRDRLSIELNRLHKIRQSDDIRQSVTQDLVEFMANSTVINADTKQNFRYRLQRSHE